MGCVVLHDCRVQYVTANLLNLYPGSIPKQFVAQEHVLYILWCREVHCRYIQPKARSAEVNMQPKSGIEAMD